MSENPYESPQTPVVPAVTEKTHAGIWRDRDLLVMAIRNPHFPPRCVKTNAPFSDASTRLDVDWIPNHGMWLLMLGAVGHAIAKSMFGRTVSVQLPLSHEWLSKRGRTSKTGWAMIIGGICCFVLGTVAYVFAMASGMDETSSQWIMFPVLASPLIAIAGVIYMFARHKPIVTARKMTNDHAWIDGLNADFLASLPEWPGYEFGLCLAENDG